MALILGNTTTAATVAVTPGVSQELARQRAALLSNLNYRLHLEIPREIDAPIAGHIEINFDLKDGAQGLQLDFRESGDKLHALRINGSDAPVRFEQEHILLDAATLHTGRNRLELDFTAGDSSLNRNPDYLYTLFVPDRARTVFPLFDQPDLKATWELTLTTPNQWVAVANSPLLEKRLLGEKTGYRFGPTKPISSYLFSFVVGKFETVTRTIAGRPMTLYHRETDGEKVARNLDPIFEAHGNALGWLEEYTGIALPFDKFDFVLIPGFPYAGMEHPGAVLYRASALLLEATPPEPTLLGRAQLIAHETAHMWFGNLVTMRWFNDVWTKEVFASFMADKLVNPDFPAIDHDLAFLLHHHPAAYAVDRSEGANAIRQYLGNLNAAGQMYGSIIYNKAPVMMRQLELITGEKDFRNGLREYLRRFAFGNASWPELVAILDNKTDRDLGTWSKVWVDTPGRPEFSISAPGRESGKSSTLVQRDPAGRNRVWPQRFSVLPPPLESGQAIQLIAGQHSVSVPIAPDNAKRSLLNADGRGYGLFPARIDFFDAWQELPAVSRGAVLVNNYENLVEGKLGDPASYLLILIHILQTETNQLLLREALGQLSRVYLTLLPEEHKVRFTGKVEQMLWRGATENSDSGLKRLYFDGFTSLASSASALEQLHAIWSQEQVLEGLPQDEDDYIGMAEILAINLPERAEKIIAAQLARTRNPDSRRRLAFIAPSLSADKATRDAFYQSLAEEKNRETEPWVIDALSRLHHPSRIEHTLVYLQPALELLEEIQVTGDIFFPSQWLEASLAPHSSLTAARTVRSFLAARPDYNPQLRMKILQEADPLFRACRLRHGRDC